MPGPSISPGKLHRTAEPRFPLIKATYDRHWPVSRNTLNGRDTEGNQGRRDFGSIEWSASLPGVLPCPSDVEWSSCIYGVGAGAVLGPFEAVGERGGGVAAEAIEDVGLVREIHGYHFRGSLRQAEGDGEVPMLLVLGSVFLPSQTRCDRA